VQEEFQSEKEELQSDAADPQHAAAQESWCKLSTSNLTM
jgi:hypothetical protein